MIFTFKFYDFYIQILRTNLSGNSRVSMITRMLYTLHGTGNIRKFSLFIFIYLQICFLTKDLAIIIYLRKYLMSNLN